jgi:hypothetical protein
MSPKLERVQLLALLAQLCRGEAGDRAGVQTTGQEASTRTIVPGSTSCMPFQNPQPGRQDMANRSRGPSMSTTLRASGFARIALGSDPNRTPSRVG